MTIMQIILLVILLVAMIVGYFLINNVPSLLHTPLMSGMNALSGITILGALTATALAVTAKSNVFALIFGSLAIICAMINVVGGFGITERMLKTITRKEKKHEK